MFVRVGLYDGHDVDDRGEQQEERRAESQAGFSKPMRIAGYELAILDS